MTETLTLSAPPAARQSLFRGLNYYTEAESDVFFGRDKETQHLYQLIKYNVLTLVFGKSGIGKTSLLNAGVFPLLRDDDCLPFPIRLKFGDNSPALKEQLVQELTNKIEQDGFSIDSFTTDDTLWEFFHREDLWKVVTPVLLFDQFEEIFTLLAANSPKTAELTALFTELSDLIENTIPEQVKAAYLKTNESIPFNYKRQRAKVIFSFREDFLPEMESITSFIPSVKNSRFRLLPMTARQAFEVITKTWTNAIQAAEARKLVFYLTNNEQTNNEELSFQLGTMALFEIEPSLLSQVCSYLEAKRVEEKQDKISSAFLEKYPKEIILHSIYHDALQDSAGSSSTTDNLDAVKKLQEFLEDNLINEEGYRIKFDKKEVSRALLPGINRLRTHYFIREEEESIELSHDVVANIVKADRDERRKTMAEAEAKTRAKRRAVKILIGAGIVVVIAAIAAFLLTNTAIDAKKEAAYWTHISDSLQKMQPVVNPKDTSKQAIARLRLLNESLSRQNNDLNRQMDSLNNQNDSLSGELGIRDTTLIRYKDQVENFKNTVASLTEENNGLQSRLSKTKMDLNSVNLQWDYQKKLFTSYNTHLLSIIRSNNQKDTAMLNYHIRLIEKHDSAFNQILH